MNLLWKTVLRQPPLSNYAWAKIITPSEMEYLVSAGVLYYTDKPARWFSIGEYDYHTDYIDNTWVALCDDEDCDNDEIELSDIEVMEMRLNEKALAEQISKVLGIAGNVSVFPYNDEIFYLGQTGGNEHYDVIFALNATKLREAIGHFCLSRKTILICVNPPQNEVQNDVLHNGGFCFLLDNVIEFSQKGFRQLEELQNVLKAPRVKKRKEGYYAWSGIVGHRIDNPVLANLHINIKDAFQLTIRLGEDERTIHYEDIAIFKNNRTKEQNDNWNMLNAAYIGQPYIKPNVNPESMKSYVRRLNKDFRDFFGFGNRATSFSYIDGKLIPNFDLKGEYHTARQRSQIFDKTGVEISESEDFKYPES